MIDNPRSRVFRGLSIFFLLFAKLIDKSFLFWDFEKVSFAARFFYYLKKDDSVELTAKIEQLVDPLLEELGLELVDIEYRRESQGWVLRFFLDKEGGITLDDCAAASRQISSLLDVEDFIPNTYNLEVSSPGLERPLKKRGDFERFSGHRVKIKTIDPIDPDGHSKRRKTFTGVLDGVEGDEVILELDGRTAVRVHIRLQNIDAAHLVLDF